MLYSIYETAILKTIIPLQHGDSFVLASFISTDMCLKLTSRKYSMQGDNNILISACGFVRAISLA